MRLVSLALLLAAPVAAQVSPLDLRPGPASSGPVPVGEAGGRLVFAADDGTGRALFATDGTAAVRLAGGAALYQSAQLSGDLYFFLCERPGAGRCSLARTDGTAAGTTRVAALPEAERVGYLAATADRLFFLLRPASGAEAGTQLWTSDGSASGTRAVEGAAPRVNDGLRYVVTASADRAYFSAGDATELWASDGEGAERIAEFPSSRGDGFFYGTALGRGVRAFALVAEAETPGLYAVDDGGARLVAPLEVGPSNATAVPFGDGVLLGAYAGGSEAQPLRPVAFYAAGADGVERVGPDLPATDLRGHQVVSPLSDGSVALAVGRSPTEVWRVAPGGQAQFAFRLPDGEEPLAAPGLFDAAREARPAPAVALADGALHALSLRDDDAGRFVYSLWRDAGDGTARLVTRYTQPEGLHLSPQFAEAGGAAFVTFWTPAAGFEIAALGRAGTSVEPPGPDVRLALQLEGAHPVRDRARLRLTAPAGGRVRVEAFSALGRRVAVLWDGLTPTVAVPFNAAGLAPGVYVVRAAVGPERASVRVVVAR